MVLKFGSDSKRLRILSRRLKNTKAVKEFQESSEGVSMGLICFHEYPPLICNVPARLTTLGAR